MYYINFQRVITFGELLLLLKVATLQQVSNFEMLVTAAY